MIGILILTITAFILSIILVLSIEESKLDDKEILKNLPGLNCGTCGFGSCKGMVEAIKENKDNYLKCRPLRGEKKENLERILNK
ncbi:MAG: hypothetical protein E7169_00415 [Firmicutes bacterium]|nr:hypothetical protein [Bacillota bacterium]